MQRHTVVLEYEGLEGLEAHIVTVETQEGEEVLDGEGVQAHKS